MPFVNFPTIGKHGSANARVISETNKGNIQKIIVGYGHVIDSLQFHYQHGIGERFGGTGGRENRFTLEKHEYLRMITLRGDENFIYQIIFFTTQDRMFDCNGSSQNVGHTRRHGHNDRGLNRTNFSGVRCHIDDQCRYADHIVLPTIALFFGSIPDIYLGYRSTLEQSVARLTADNSALNQTAGEQRERAVINRRQAEIQTECYQNLAEERAQEISILTQTAKDSAVINTHQEEIQTAKYQHLEEETAQEIATLTRTIQELRLHTSDEVKAFIASWIERYLAYQLPVDRDEILVLAGLQHFSEDNLATMNIELNIYYRSISHPLLPEEISFAYSVGNTYSVENSIVEVGTVLSGDS
jgi:hypothetical protein